VFQGTRQPFVMETVKADDAAKLGTVCIHLYVPVNETASGGKVNPD
jgi:hypothetical protein